MCPFLAPGVHARIGGRPISSSEVLYLCSLSMRGEADQICGEYSLARRAGAIDGAGGGGCGILISQKSNPYPSPVLVRCVGGCKSLVWFAESRVKRDYGSSANGERSGAVLWCWRAGL